MFPSPSLTSSFSRQSRPRHARAKVASGGLRGYTGFKVFEKPGSTRDFSLFEKETRQSSAFAQTAQKDAMTLADGSQYLSKSTLGKLGLPTNLEVTAVQLVAAVLAQEFRDEGPAAVQGGAIAFVNRMIQAQGGENWGQKQGVSQPGLKDNLMLQLVSAPNQFTALSINPGRIGKVLGGKVDSLEYGYATQKLGSYNDGKTTLGGFRQIWNGKTMLYDVGARDQWRSTMNGYKARDNSLIIGNTHFFNED